MLDSTHCWNIIETVHVCKLTVSFFLYLHPVLYTWHDYIQLRVGG